MQSPPRCAKWKLSVCFEIAQEKRRLNLNRLLKSSRLIHTSCVSFSHFPLRSQFSQLHKPPASSSLVLLTKDINPTFPLFPLGVNLCFEGVQNSSPPTSSFSTFPDTSLQKPTQPLPFWGRRKLRPPATGVACWSWAATALWVGRFVAWRCSEASP